MLLGTSAIAKLLSVTPRTVAKFCDDGRLPFHQLPGSRHRRVQLPDLVTFMRDHKFPDKMIAAAQSMDPATPESAAVVQPCHATGGAQ